MASPGGKEVGRVSIRALPDTSSFARSLQAYLERTEQRLRLNIPVSLDQKDVAKTEAELDALTRNREVDLEVNTRNLERNIERVTDTGSRGFGRMGLIIGAVTVAVGTLAAALPAMLAILGTPVLAIIAGFDGIKKAATVLADEMDHLRKSVSGVFEQLLTPGFERLGKLFPVLEKGLGNIAGAISEVFDAFSRALTTTESMKTLGDIFDNIATVIQGFARGGGMEAFVNSLLTLADAGTKVAAALTPQFVATFTAFNDQIERMSKNGDLQKGMEGIGHAILIVLIALGVLVVVTIEAFAAIERAGEKLVKFFTKTLPEGTAALKIAIQADFKAIVTAITGAWATVKTKTSQAWNAIVTFVKTKGGQLLAFVRSIPGQIAGFFKSLPGQMVKIGSSIVNGLVNGIKGAWHLVTAKVKALIAQIPLVIRRLLGIASPSRVMMELGGFIGEGLALGIEKSLAGVEASATLVAQAPIRAASARSFDTGTANATDASRPIIMPDGTLFGWMVAIADGRTELHLNKAAMLRTVNA